MHTFSWLDLCDRLSAVASTLHRSVSGRLGPKPLSHPHAQSYSSTLFSRRQSDARQDPGSSSGQGSYKTRASIDVTMWKLNSV